MKQETYDSLVAALAAQSEEKRDNREGKVAAAAALRDLMARGGTTRPPAELAHELKRLDGRSLVQGQKRESTRRAGSTGTNQADHITSASTPLETDRQDY